MNYPIHPRGVQIRITRMEANDPPAGNDAPAADIPQGKSLGFLAWIAGYKLIKAILALAGGIMVLHLGNRNLVELATRWLVSLRFDPEGWVGARLLRQLGYLDPNRLHFAGQLLFVYTILYCIEAVGLFLEKRWAEWLTVVQTSILIPVEVYELHRRAGPIKVVALIFSVSVVIYLLWRIQRDSREEAGTAGAEGPRIRRGNLRESH